MAKNASFVLVAYDIIDDKRRTRIMNTLLDYGGKRVNYSVFECLLTQLELKKLRGELEGIIDRSEDNIRFYILCEKCIKNIENYGVEVISILDEVRIEFF
ncbi:MAG: CRISPR-associated endonuclease Cas2 [Nitrospirae bacterium]|nr:MAG: CRISPR-associated endonuclease Cas2 [Nitrospirota bacterium]